jgi:hypothetical protein
MRGKENKIKAQIKKETTNTKIHTTREKKINQEKPEEPNMKIRKN